MLPGKHELDDKVRKYFEGQFISAAEATADILGDPIFRFDRQAPMVFPDWLESRIFGDWKRYLFRMT